MMTNIVQKSSKASHSEKLLLLVVVLPLVAELRNCMTPAVTQTGHLLVLVYCIFKIKDYRFCLIYILRFKIRHVVE